MNFDDLKEDAPTKPPSFDDLKEDAPQAPASGLGDFLKGAQKYAPQAPLFAARQALKGLGISGEDKEQPEGITPISSPIDTLAGGAAGQIANKVAAPVAGEAVGAMESGAQRLGRGFLGRVKGMNPAERGAYQGTPEAVSEMASHLGKPGTEVQDQAIAAINRAQAGLKEQGLDKSAQLAGYLHGNEVNAGGMMMDANEANELKRNLQERAKFKLGSPTGPVQEASRADAASSSNELKRLLEGVDENVEPLNKEMQQSKLLQKAAGKGVKNNPIGFTQPSSPDAQAQLSRISQHGGGTSIQDFASQLGAAQKLNTPTAANAAKIAGGVAGVGSAGLGLADLLKKLRQ